MRSRHFPNIVVDIFSDYIAELVERVTASGQFKRVIRFWGPGATASVLAK